MISFSTIEKVLSPVLSRAQLFKHGFNLAPMYRATNGRITYVKEDLSEIRTRTKLNYRTKNYVGTMFGGAMFSSVDPFPMVQLINILGKDYVVWDKAADIRFRRPATQDLVAVFQYSGEEVADIKAKVAKNGELQLDKVTELREVDSNELCCIVSKTLYIASKEHFAKKQRLRASKT